MILLSTVMMRGHGGSEYPPAPLNDGLSFDAFAEDLRHVV